MKPNERFTIWNFISIYYLSRNDDKKYHKEHEWIWRTRTQSIIEHLLGQLHNS